MCENMATEKEQGGAGSPEGCEQYRGAFHSPAGSPWPGDRVAPEEDRDLGWSTWVLSMGPSLTSGT